MIFWTRRQVGAHRAKGERLGLFLFVVAADCPLYRPHTELITLVPLLIEAVFRAQVDVRTEVVKKFLVNLIQTLASFNGWHGLQQLFQLHHFLRRLAHRFRVRHLRY